MGPGRPWQSASQHHGKHIVAEIADVLALKESILRLEPFDKSGNALLKTVVAADFDSARNFPDKEKLARFSDDMDAIGSNGKKRKGFGHGLGCWWWGKLSLPIQLQ
jgi:hypothetical protein